MSAESAVICESNTSSAVFDSWSHVETASRSPMVAEVGACVTQAVDRRRSVKDSQEQWYVVCGIRPSSEDSACRFGVRISNLKEEGRVEYVPVSVPSISTPVPDNLRVSSGESKRRKISRSPVKRRFKIASPPPLSQQHREVGNLGFNAALDRQQSRKSRRSERNLFSKWDCHNCWCFVSNFEKCSIISIWCHVLVICSLKLFAFLSCLFWHSVQLNTPGK